VDFYQQTARIPHNFSADIFHKMKLCIRFFRMHHGESENRSSEAASASDLFLAPPKLSIYLIFLRKNKLSFEVLTSLQATQKVKQNGHSNGSQNNDNNKHDEFPLVSSPKCMSSVLRGRVCASVRKSFRFLDINVADGRVWRGE
jgi:hypothetical protein